jgi:hypothetical protein
MDKTIAANERTSKHLKELNIQAAKAVVAAATVIDDVTCKSGSLRPNGLTRRHTITSMPITAALYQATPKLIPEPPPPTPALAETNAVVLTPIRRRQTAVVDSKAYVGSFTLNRVSASLNATPTRRCSFNTIHKQLPTPGYTPTLSNESTPVKLLCGGVGVPGATRAANNFNTDFYRLCSDTFYYGSDANLNPSTSNSSLSKHNQQQHQQQQSGQHRHPNESDDEDESDASVNQHQHQQPTPQQQNLCQTANLTAHVNHLFDQWLSTTK